MFDQLCRNNSCFNSSDKKFQVQVPPFYQVQQQINQLPPFEHRYSDHTPHQIASSFRRINQSHSQSEGTILKRVKSEPDYQIMTPIVNEKENRKECSVTDFHQTPKAFKQQSAPRPQIRILYDSNQSSSGYKANKDLFKSCTNTNYTQNKQSVPIMQHQINTSNFHSPKNNNQFVSVEQFNRIVNINMNLIKMIQEDYKPIKSTVNHLEVQQQERTKLIQVLEDRVRKLRKEMDGGGRKKVDHRFY